MITTEIGYSLINAYNKKYGTDHNGKSFFIDVFHKLFYDDEKYMNWITNSPLVQSVRKGNPPTKEDRTNYLQKLIDKVNSGACDASVGIGYSSTDIAATTSGQVSDIRIKPEKDELYASWVGSGLGIGISGGVSLFIKKPSLLLKLFDGWKYYRQYLNELPNLKGNQIDAWNGQWLCHVNDMRIYNHQNPTANFNPFKTGNDGITQLVTKKWTTIVFTLSKLFPNEVIIPYVCAIAKVNRTYGYIPMMLHQVRKPLQLYKKLFGENTYLNDVKIINKLFGDGDSFYVACSKGVIGLEQIKPIKFNQLFEKKLKTKPSDEDIISYRTYITYILAIMDNKNIQELAIKFAKFLKDFRESSTRAKSTNARIVENLLSSNSPTQFLEIISAILDGVSNTDIISELITAVNDFSHENYKRFVVLIKLYLKL